MGLRLIALSGLWSSAKTVFSHLRTYLTVKNKEFIGTHNSQCTRGEIPHNEAPAVYERQKKSSLPGLS